MFTEMKNLLFKLHVLYTKFLLNFINTFNIDGIIIRVKKADVALPLIFSKSIVYNVKGKSVLDLGTGSGVIALHAKKAGAKKVVGVDINKNAILCAENNLKNNFSNKENIEFIQSNLFSNVKGRFDLIITNPPFLNESAKSIHDYKSKGKDILEKILMNCHKYLKKDGEIRILFPKNKSKEIRHLAEKYNYKVIQNSYKTKYIWYRFLFYFFYQPRFYLYVLKK